MPDTKAKIGDTIRIIEGICGGDEFRVIKCPDDKIDIDRPGYIWCVAVDDEENSGYFMQETKYEIIGQSSKSPTVSYGDNVDNNMKTRRDENLRRIFE